MEISIKVPDGELADEMSKAAEDAGTDLGTLLGQLLLLLLKHAGPARVADDFARAQLFSMQMAARSAPPEQRRAAMAAVAAARSALRAPAKAGGISEVVSKTTTNVKGAPQ